MGLIADLADNIRNQAPPVFQQTTYGGLGTSTGSYESYARQGYSGNEIVFSCINLLASSASEPHIAGRRLRKDKPRVRAETSILQSKGIPQAQVNARLIQNKFIEDLPNHPLVYLLNHPNPFMSRGQLWGTVVMDRSLAGNSYLLKSRAQNGPLKGAVAELWRLRPDRVTVIPSKTNYIEGYEYRVGNDVVRFPAEDVIHFKTRNPLNEYYGMPPLMAASGRVDIDNYMRSFLRTFFERGGAGPGSVLAIKQRLTPEAKDSIRDKFKRQFGGSAGFHEMLVLDQAEATYTQMGLDRGLRDALPKELNAMQEARIAMVFGIPGSILGLLIGYESSSYANKRADWQVLWDVTMTPLLSDLDDVLNLSLVPEYAGIDEVYFDLSDIKALREDVDAIQDRTRKNFAAGLVTFEEGRDELGYDPNNIDGWLLLPEYLTARRYEDFGVLPISDTGDTTGGDGGGGDTSEPPGARPEAIVAEPRCPQCRNRVGRNIQVGGELMCRHCKLAFKVVDRTNGVTA